jgi:hypothetical protein
MQYHILGQIEYADIFKALICKDRDAYSDSLSCVDWCVMDNAIRTCDESYR